MTKTWKVALHFNMARVHQQGIVRGIIEYATVRGNWKLFGSFWTLESVKDLRRWDGDGVIAAVEDPASARTLRRSGVPVVDIAETVGGVGFSLVTNDNIETGRMGGEYLIATGLSNFAYCGVADAVWSEKRLEGFTCAVGTAVAGFSNTAQWWQTGDIPRELTSFLKKLPKPIGLMAANDTVGVKVAGACRAAGLHVPDEVAIVGVDNEDILCQLSATHLSSIPFDRREIGFRAAERLDALMRGLVDAMPPLAVPPLPVVTRASTEVVIASDPLVREAMKVIRDKAGRLGADEVAPEVYSSRRNLERRFRAGTGRGLLEEIHRVRVNYAKRLLRESDLPLGKIAAAAGFQSPQRFSAVFRRYAGMSPPEFRRGAGVMRT